MPSLKKKPAPKRKPRQKPKVSQLEAYLEGLRGRLAMNRTIFVGDYSWGTSFLSVPQNYRAASLFIHG